MSYLGDFLFSPARANAPLSTLSGGERNRVLLARLLALPANVLVLDEPTNDLDIDTLELLEELLQIYAGTVFLVSHDRRFLDNVVTSTIAWEGDVAPGLWREYEGGYEDWRTQRERSRALRETSERKPAPPARKAAPASAAPSAKKRKLGYKEQRELDALAGADRRARAGAEGSRRAARERRALRRGSGARRGGADALRADRRRAARGARTLGAARVLCVARRRRASRRPAIVAIGPSVLERCGSRTLHCGDPPDEDRRCKRAVPPRPGASPRAPRA